MRLLLAEDDLALAKTLTKGLRENSFAVDVARDGEDALFKIEVSEFDVVILDVMLPKLDGFDVCREIRALGRTTPVLMLTARDATSDKIAGLDSGADDYLTKPFDFGELLARIRALLRRPHDFRPAVIEIADLFIDVASRRVTRSGVDIELTQKEFALLEFLARERGRVLGRAKIAEHVWDENFDPFSNVIDVYVKRLRAKLDDGRLPKLIHTRRGAGYVLDDV